MMANQLKTTVLLAALTVLIVLIGRMFGGNQGMMIAFVFAMVMNFGSYWFSDKIVLAMYRAKELTPSEAPRIHQVVAELAQKGGIPKPRVYLIPSETPNAFATGRNPEHAVVAVTQGIVRLLDDDELKGVLGHELGHVKNRDQLMQAVKAVVDDSTITSHIKRIRQKFQKLDPNFDAIETVYGMGYRWNTR